MKNINLFGCSLLLLSLSAASFAKDPFSLDELAAFFAQRQANLEERHRDPQVGQVVTADGRNIPVYAVGLKDSISEPGQSLSSFLASSGDPLRQRTAETGWEVCARICVSKDGRYGIRPATLRASLVCATSANICPAGFLATDKNVHTHGDGTVAVPTEADLLINPAAEVTSIIPNELSPEDMAVPGTWLLAPDGSLKHN